jgi:hypothetical protein
MLDVGMQLARQQRKAGCMLTSFMLKSQRKLLRKYSNVAEDFI